MFDLLSKNEMVGNMDKAMTVASRRMALVASNLANIDTPEYRTRDLPFHETLQAILNNEHRQCLPLARTHPMHFSDCCPDGLPFFNIDQAITAYERNDGNDVSLDSENMKAMKTNGAFTQATMFTQSAIRRVFAAIREGAR